MISKKEWLKNLKPLEALNQLKNIPIYETSMYGDKYYYKGRLYDIYTYKRMVNIIKHTLENYEKLKAQDENNKKLKALEILKKEPFISVNWYLEGTYEEYKNAIEKVKITEEEWNFVKEVLL